MRSRRPLFTMAAAMLIFCATSGCDGLTIGPRVKTVYVLVHPGRPLLVLENATVRGRVMDGSGDSVRENIGGWVAMPQDHWEVLRKAAGLEATSPPGEAKEQPAWWKFWRSRDGQEETSP